MEDRTFLTNNHPTNDISDTFRQFIEALVEEVVINGEPFDAQKKWLRKRSEAEGQDYASLEKNLMDFFVAVKEWKSMKLKSSEMAVRFLAKGCYLSDNAVKKLMDGRATAPVSIPLATEFVSPSLLMRNGKLVEMERGGHIISPSEWQLGWNFSEGLARVEADNRLQGYIDTMGNIAIPCKWDMARDFSEGLAWVAQKQESGLIDKSGKMVFSNNPHTKSFDICGDFHEGLAVVSDNQSDKFGFIDKSGHVAIPCKWNEAYGFEEGLAVVWDDTGQCGCIDKKGRLVIPCQYIEDADLYFHEGIATVYREYKNGGSYLMNKAGQKICDLGFGCGTVYFKEGLGSIENYGFIDKNGKLLIEDIWSPEGMGFSEGLAPTEEGYIDHLGNIVIPSNWEQCFEFHEGLAMVVKDDKYGYIDHSGCIIIPCIWDHAKPFSEGLASVELNEKYYYINKQGEVLCKVR